MAALRSSDRKTYIAEAAQALEEFRAQQKKLRELGRGAGPRATHTIGDAQQEITQLHTELARAVSAGLSLR